MAEGNTLFLLSSSNLFSEDETTDEFGLMPFLSEDGTRNTFVLNVNRYIGINKHLEAEGSEQKFEDALHVMEVLSSVEGMQALNSFYSDTSLLPLKDYTVSTEGYYADILDELSSGATAPLIFTGAVAYAAVPDSVLKPAMALPMHLYLLVAQGETSMGAAYGTAFVMMALILICNLLASIYAGRSHKR